MSIRKRRTSRTPKRLRKLLRRLTPKSRNYFAKLLKASVEFKIKQSENESCEADVKAEFKLPGCIEEQEDSLKLNQKPILPEGSYLLTEELATKIVRYLPFTYRKQTWECTFSTAVDGYNLHAIYNKIKKHKIASRSTPGFLLVIRDTNNASFCAYVSEALELRNEYYGNGESFVGKLHPEFNIFTATQENMYYILSKDEILAFGGGGSFALFLDMALENGMSDSCSTYNNSVLASGSTFQCSEVEVWTFSNSLFTGKILYS